MSQATASLCPWDITTLLFARRGDQVLFTSGASAGTFNTAELVSALARGVPTARPSLHELSIVNSELCIDGVQRPVTIYETRARDAELVGDIAGLVLVDESRIKDPARTDYFVRLILTMMKVGVAFMPVSLDKAATETTTEQIVRVYEDHLRHSPEKDLWDTEGRAYFTSKVSYFVERQARLEFILPAFPFKSNNINKVTGKTVDMGEELAMRTLARFISEIKAIYKPGAKFLVVSDGHVFSDVMGVDDAVCHNYNDDLRALAVKLWRPDQRDLPFSELVRLAHGPSASGREMDSLGIGFYSLEDLLRPPIVPMHDAERTSFYSDVIEHEVDTQLTDDAEQCRQVLMGICAGDPACLRQRIKDDASVCALYRGFTIFMKEDLERNRCMTECASKTQRQLLAKRIGFVMLRRNEAYSRLVEFIFPIHLRLSIHPHPNAGPKFGINLIHPTYLSSTDTTSLKSNQRALHTPTPWHNSMVLTKEGYFEVKRARLIRQLMADGEKVYRWVERGVDGDGVGGGYFEEIGRTTDEVAGGSRIIHVNEADVNTASGKFATSGANLPPLRIVSRASV